MNPSLAVLCDKCQKYGIKLIYGTNDILLGVKKNSSSYEYVYGVSASIENFIDTGDVITFTT